MDNNKAAIYQQLTSLRNKMARIKCRCANCETEKAGGEKTVNFAGIRLHNCYFEECRAVFDSPSHLEDHVRRRHTGERPFVCELHGCERKFISKSDLKCHLIRHTGEKNFICFICGFRTSIKPYLTRHMKTHSKNSLLDTEDRAPAVDDSPENPDISGIHKTKTKVFYNLLKIALKFVPPGCYQLYQLNPQQQLSSNHLEKSFLKQEEIKIEKNDFIIQIDESAQNLFEEATKE